jgi:anti-sigma factor RsiW
MSATSPHSSACSSAEIVAYVDGELGTEARRLLEEHLAECPHCDSELKTQQRLLRELDFALAEDACPEMPKNFAQVVAMRAQADLSGVRSARERGRALRLCVALSVIAFALLGGAALSESVFSPLRTAWKGFAAVFSFLSHALYDLGAGVAVITRGVGGHLLFESRGLSLIVLLTFASALFMLRRLITGYHRARAIE